MRKRDRWRRIVVGTDRPEKSKQKHQVRDPCEQRNVNLGTAEVRVPYLVVQPWGDRAGEWTLIDTRSTVRDAFAALDALSAQMVRTGAPSDAVKLTVVDAAGARAARPDTQ